MARRTYRTKLPAPFLTRISLKADVLEGREGYPFDLPWLRDEDFALEFTTPVTIIVGENGSGKSTLTEALAHVAGFGQSGGNRDHAGGHSEGREASGGQLGEALRGAWLPKVTQGWFFRAETFFQIARYLDGTGSPHADFLSWSHGEGFVRVFHERMSGQGFYLMDEPESALSPKRQLELLRLLADIQETARAQVIMATHSPLLMAVPGARLLEATRFGFIERRYTETAHFKLYRAFTADPDGFIAEALEDQGDSLP